MELKARHWLMALVSAIAVHLSLLILFEHPAQPLAQGQGILIELGDGGDVGERASGAEILSPLGAEDLPEAEPAALQTVESEAFSEIRAEDMDAVELEASEDPITVAEAVPVPNAERIVAEPPAPAKPDTTIRPKPTPKIQKKARSTRTKKKARETRRNMKISKVSARKAAVGGGTAKARKGTGKPGSGAAAAARNRYAEQISAWLNRNKRYPKQARRRGQHGSVTVRFTVDPDGRVLSSNIVRSSGHAALDDEVRALLSRGRMPRMPKDMKQARMTMTVPIRFRLQ